MDHPIAEPASLASLVDYQEGSVVSRVIFRNAGGTMTVFAFAEGEGLTEHSNPNDAIVHVIEGSLRLLIGEVEYQLETGQALHLPASVPHTLLGGEQFKMLLTILRTTAAA